MPVCNVLQSLTPNMTTRILVLSIVAVLLVVGTLVSSTIASATVEVFSNSTHSVDQEDQWGSSRTESSINHFHNNSPIACRNAHRSIEEFPPDFFNEEQRRHGAIIFHLLVAFYGFIFITFVCHDYYLPSVACICLDLGISPDVAGATFMAMATCTSELIVSVIGTFLTKSDLGVGTVVGSGVYNTLGVSACAGLAARQAIPVEKWPLLRDSCVYMMSIAVLAVIAFDNVVVWYEALAMIIMYFGYFLFLFTQGELVNKFKNKNESRSWNALFEHIKILILSVMFCEKLISNESQNITAHKNDIHYGTFEYRDIPTITVTTTTSSESNDKMNVEEQTSHSSELPASDDRLLPIVWRTFCFPVTFTLSSTIPDCRTNRKHYPVTFVMSVVWVSAVTYVLSWMLTVCGDTFHVSDIVMGIGVLAVGNSIPEAVSGVINARNGEGSMSISSALGSNTMDILLCLGLPWSVHCLLPASMGGGPLRLETDSLFFNCACMAASVVVLNAAAAVAGFRMHAPFGVWCLVGQMVVMAVLMVNALNDAAAAARPSCSAGR